MVTDNRGTATCQRSALCRWLTLVLRPILAFWGEPRNETKLGSSTATLTEDVDMLASFLSSFLLLAVRVGPYCKQREAGRGFQGYRCAASDTSFALLVEAWHYFCVAVSSLRQHCHRLVVNYFRCTSGPVQVLTRAVQITEVQISTFTVV